MPEDWANFKREVEKLIADAMEEYAEIDEVVDDIGCAVRESWNSPHHDDAPMTAGQPNIMR